MTPLVQNSPMNLASTFPQPANTEDNIIEVLKYSQQDMDAAVAKIQKEVRICFPRPFQSSHDHFHL
jgi:hypothetical protein